MNMITAVEKSPADRSKSPYKKAGIVLAAGALIAAVSFMAFDQDDNPRPQTTKVACGIGGFRPYTIKKHETSYGLYIETDPRAQCDKLSVLKIIAENNPAVALGNLSATKYQGHEIELPIIVIGKNVPEPFPTEQQN